MGKVREASKRRERMQASLRVWDLGLGRVAQRSSRALQRDIFKLAKQHGYCTVLILLFPTVILRARYGEGELRHLINTVQPSEEISTVAELYSIVIQRITWPRQVARSRASSNNIENQIQRRPTDSPPNLYSRRTLIATPGEPGRGWSSTPLLFPYPLLSIPPSVKPESVSGSMIRVVFYSHKGKRDNGYMSGVSQCLRLCWGFPLRNWIFKTCTNARVVSCCFRERAVTS